jgi:hypothetical protein
MASKGNAEVAGGLGRGGNGKWVVQGQQKTRTRPEIVGFMFKYIGSELYTLQSFMKSKS